eukprot:TRINITY_DN74727_c0_g1_i1.p1 TRINITY_DN74727_c0_g1~~TRINITY_DN74727_c0_g1_i1.p1  ORF type:complete len:463 (+),score=98.81 TRINITY_DN74727_c0_g1_i1:59-1447(+)
MFRLDDLLVKVVRDGVPELVPRLPQRTLGGQFVTVASLVGDSIDVPVELGETIASVARKFAVLKGLGRSSSLQLVVGDRILDGRELVDAEASLSAIVHVKSGEGEEEEAVALVLDCGSALSKVGFAGDVEPFRRGGDSLGIFPTRVAPREVQPAGHGYRSRYVGTDAVAFAGDRAGCPMQDFVTNWEDMERIWHHAFYNVLRVDPEEHPVLLTEAPLTPKADREKTVQIMFETFNVPALFIAQQAALSMFACRRSSGVLVDVGAGSGRIVSVIEGYIMPHAIRRTEVAGQALSQYLARLFADSVCDVSGGAETAQSVKEGSCYVAVDFDAELAALPTTSSHRICCPEALFRPSFAGLEGQGLHVEVLESVMRCDFSCRDALLSGIVLAGGSTMFPGINVRLQNELASLTDNQGIRIHASPERRYLAWLGGSDAASLDNFAEMWTTKEEYDESGPSIVHRRPW